MTFILWFADIDMRVNQRDAFCQLQTLTTKQDLNRLRKFLKTWDKLQPFRGKLCAVH